MNKVNVNMTPCNDVVTLHCSQGDTEARKFYVKLHNNGEAIESSDIAEQAVFSANVGGTEELLPSALMNGSVDLGSLTWIYDATVPRFYTTELNALVKAPSSNTLTANAICSMYTNTTFDKLYSTEKKNLTMAFGNTGTLNVINTSYSNAVDFKNAMQGVMLWYEMVENAPNTSPIRADIQYPDGLREDQEFTYRESPTTKDGYAKITSLKGNTLVWNQLFNKDNFRASASSNGIDFTNNGDGSITMNGTATAQSTFIFQNNAFTAVQGHKYTCGFQTSSGGWYLGFDGVGFSLNVSVPGIVPLSQSGGNVLYSYLRVPNGVTVSNVKVYPQIFDLTQMGLDSITSVDEFTSLFPLPYYQFEQGNLLSFNGTGIKTTGKNLINIAEFVQRSGYTNLSVSQENNIITVSGYSAGGRFACFNVPLIVGKQYTIKLTARNNVTGVSFIQISEKPTSWVGNGTSIGLNAPVTFTANNPWVQVVIEASADNASVTDLQLELGSTATSYEAYKETTTSLPTSTYFPTGMKSAGSVYDELTPTKAITRIGSVDLGSLAWTYVAANTRFQATMPSDYKTPTSVSDRKNMRCAKYETNSNPLLTSGNGITGYQNSSLVYCRDSAYTDATAFTNAMNGIYLYYELATPLENYGIVDLGTLTWYSEGTNTSGIVRMGSTGIRDFVKKPTSGSITANIVCDAYLTETADRTYLKNKGISINTGGTICVYDPNYNTSDKIASFKSAMSGVYLLYEKANPQSLTTASIVTKKGEIALAPQDEYLVGECYSNISENAGFLEAKVKLTDEDGDLYSTKIQIHVERKP